MVKIGREYIDDLTGFYNRRYLLTLIPGQLEEAQRKDIPLSIVLIDLDHFKNVNDTYGHTRGDVVLKEFGIFIKALLRADDTVFRYGGDEFVCILPNADYEQAKMISQRFIEQCRIKEFVQIRLTLSIGIASCPLDARDWQTLFEIADRNLYSAKRHGRDRIGIFEKEEKTLIIPTEEIIGRDEEISRIKEFINPIIKGNGGAMCISGEIGVGKTRLVQEIVRDSDFQDIHFLRSNLSATTKSIPYYPFREIIRGVINKTDRKSFNQIPEAYQIELVKIVPELSDKSKEVDKDIFMLDKFRLFEGVRRFLSLCASKTPIFICLDNIHWADNGSMELLHYLIRALKNSSIFFFFVYRVEEARSSSFQNVLQLMAREGLYEKIDLEPLQPADVARMLSLMIDGIPSPELTEYIYKETGGNPFFVEELMKSLATNGALIQAKDKLIFDKSKRVVIPYSVGGVIDRKFGMMSNEACDLLKYATVIGREFDFAFLRDITKMNEGQLFDLMDEILKMRLLKESGEERYFFSKDIAREIIYQQINKIKLRRYHQVVGEMLLSLHKNHIEEVVEELSHHFYLSGDRDKAIEYSVIAADRAKTSYANRDAIGFYTRVLECLKDKTVEGSELTEIECLKNRAEVLNLIGDNEKAGDDVNNAINKAKVMGNRKLEADCLVILFKVYQDISQYREAAEKAETALKIYRDLNNREGEASSLRNIATVYFYLGKYPKALEYYQDSFKIRKEIGYQRGEAQSLNNIGVVYDHLGDYSKALELYQHSLKIIKEIGDLKLEAAILNNIGLVNQNFGDYAKALDFYKRSLRIMKEMGDRRGEARILNNIGSIYHSLSEYTKALEFYQRSLKIMKEIGDYQAEATNLYNIAIIINNLGDHSKALDFYQRSLKITEDIGDRKIEAANLINIGALFIETADFVVAEKYFRKAYSIAKEIKSKLLLAYVYLGLTSLYLEKYNLVEVKKGLEKILSFADKLSSKEIKAEGLCLAGRLYTKKKKWNKAKSSFKESILIFKQIKNSFKLAQVYYYQGLMLKESDDKTEAKKSHTMAMKIFKKLDVQTWIEKVEKAIKIGREKGKEGKKRVKKVTRGQGDKGTRGHGDKETGRQGDTENLKTRRTSSKSQIPRTKR